jgi:hypothetical protein
MHRPTAGGQVVLILLLVAGIVRPAIAQARALGFQPFNAIEREQPAAPIRILPDSVRQPPPTHWRAGLLVGATLGGIFGGYLGHGLCRDSDSAHGSCFGSLIGGAVVLAVPAGVVGALIGGAFPARTPPPDSTQR